MAEAVEARLARGRSCLGGEPRKPRGERSGPIAGRAEGDFAKQFGFLLFQASSHECLEPKPEKLVIKLADGKARQIQHMSVTTFWGPDGKPLSPAQFVESLFGALPEFFKNEDEDELRAIWADPTTRKGLLDALAEKGFGREPLA